MDPHAIPKHSAKVIISETLMFLAVILTVAILALLVSGYWLNSDFKVERNGMLQIASMPTGASIEIDNQPSSWLERTNSSKILSSGEHSVKLTKEGYDSWSKTINISEGLLYQLRYPKLFLQNRATEEVLNVGTYTGATVSPDYNSLVLFNDNAKWGFVNLDTENLTIKPFDVSKLLSSENTSDNAGDATFYSEIISVDWDFDSSHILIKTKRSENTEWLLLDVHNPDKSLNLTKEFGTNFSDIEIIDNNSNTLLAVRDGNLHKLDIPSRVLSAVLAKNVNDFDHYNSEIVFSATHDPADQASMQYYVGYFKLGDGKITELEQTEAPAKVIISRFYDEKNIIVAQYNKVSIHDKEFYDNPPKEYYLPFSPNQIKAGYSGEFLFFAKNNDLASLDMEANAVREWTIEHHYDWLDGSMLYAVKDGELIVYDFDGLNRRSIAKNVSSRFPVTITSDKWLYYFSDGELIREWLITK